MIQDLKAQILGANDSTSEPVDLPSWGSPKVFVRVMSGEERDDFEAGCMLSRGKKHSANLANIRARLAVKCLVDENGNRVFDDADAPALGKKSGAELQAIFDVAQRLNKLTEADVDELTKNS